MATIPNLVNLGKCNCSNFCITNFQKLHHKFLRKNVTRKIFTKKENSREKKTKKWIKKTFKEVGPRIKTLNIKEKLWKMTISKFRFLDVRTFSKFYEMFYLLLSTQFFEYVVDPCKNKLDKLPVQTAY